jgi:hypothetical protein
MRRAMGCEGDGRPAPSLCATRLPMGCLASMGTPYVVSRNEGPVLSAYGYQGNRQILHEGLLAGGSVYRERK